MGRVIFNICNYFLYIFFFSEKIMKFEEIFEMTRFSRFPKVVMERKVLYSLSVVIFIIFWKNSEVCRDFFYLCQGGNGAKKVYIQYIWLFLRILGKSS